MSTNREECIRSAAIDFLKDDISEKCTISTVDSTTDSESDFCGIKIELESGDVLIQIKEIDQGMFCKTESREVYNSFFKES